MTNFINGTRHSRLVLTALGAMTGAVFLLGAAVPAQAALTQGQIGSIVALLQSFNVDASTIANVQSVLSDATTTGSGTNTSTVTGAMIGYLHRGDDDQGVCYLHALLAADPNVSVDITAADMNDHCPFGPLTEQAVRQFQKDHGIPQVGFIGPQTLKELEQDLEDNPIGDQEDSSGHHEACAIVPPGHLVAPGWLRKHDYEESVVPTCQELPPGIENRLDSVSISNLAASDVSTSTATVSWATDGPATGAVYYATSSPIVFSTAASLRNSSLVTAHSFGFSGLTATTTYYYAVVSSDASGNTATSSTASFTTAR